MSQGFNWIGVDQSKKKKGVWVDHPSGKFLIGSPNSLQATRCLEGYVELVQKKHSTKEDPLGQKYILKMSEQLECATKVVAELKVLDWDIKDGEGNPIKFSQKAAFDALINDKEYADELKKEEGLDDDEELEDYITFIDWVNTQSNTLSNYDNSKREEDVKK